MSSFYIVPGVYSSELDLTGSTAAVSTTIGAMAFPSRKGPIDLYFETDVNNFTTLYGDNDFSWTFAHACIKAFMAVAQGIYLKRVANLAKYAGSIVSNDVNGLNATQTSMTPFPNGRYDDYTVGGQDFQLISLSGPLVTGNTIGLTLTSDNGTVHTFSQLFTTNSDTTLQALATTIDNLLQVTPFAITGKAGGDFSVVIPDSTGNDARSLQLISPEGTQVTVSAISISGGASQPTATVNVSPWLFEVWAENPGVHADDVGYRILNVEQGVAQRIQIAFSSAMVTGSSFTCNLKYNDEYIAFNPVAFTLNHANTATLILAEFQRLLGESSTGYTTDSTGLAIVVVSPVDGPNTFTITNATVSNGITNPTCVVSQVLTGVASDDTFDIWVYTRDNVNSPIEKHTVSFISQLDGFGNQLFIEDEVNTSANASNYIRIRYNHSNAAAQLIALPTAGTAIQWLNGGDDGILPTNAQIAAQWQSTFSSRKKCPCSLLINGGHSSPVIQQQIDSICQSRADCFGILDMPSASQITSTAAVSYRNDTLDLSSSYTAIYSPDVLITDSASNTTIFIPPSGHVAAQFAYNDYVAAAWYNPAGLNRGLILNITGLRVNYDEGDMQLLISNQINPIIKESGIGYQIKSANTLQTKSSALSNIGVRRLLIVIELSLTQALNYSIHEPNTAYTRFLITQLCTSFLQPIKDESGLYDYAVVCDDRNTTSYLIDEGQANVDVYLKPVLPIKFIQLRSIITKTGAYFQETIAALSASGS